MKKTLILFVIGFLFIPAVVFPMDVDKSTDEILDRATPWEHKIKLIDEIAAIGSAKILEVLITVYDDSSLHSGCPSILYHTVNGMRYFRGNIRALRIVRDGTTNREPEVRMISLEVLGIIGSEEDIGILKPFLRNKNSFEAYYAQISINNIKTRAQRSAL